MLSPSFTNLGVEVPSLPAEIFSAFSDNSDLVIFDVGGDDTGAIALGQYHRFFSKIDRSAIEVLYVDERKGVPSPPNSNPTLT